MEKVILFFLKIQTVFAQEGINSGGGGGLNSGGSGGINSGGTGNPTIPDPLQGKELIEIIANITNFLVLKIAPPLVAILIVIGAFQMMLAGGNPEKIQTGKKTILWAVVGFVIVLLASGVASLIKNIITGN